jgi:hypothetical protein
MLARKDRKDAIMLIKQSRAPTKKRMTIFTTQPKAEAGMNGTGCILKILQMAFKTVRIQP